MGSSFKSDFLSSFCFDLRNDSGETRNFYDERPEVATEYHAILTKQLQTSLSIELMPGGRESLSTGQEGIEEKVWDTLMAWGIWMRSEGRSGSECSW